jgi:hypothetical protein
MPEVSDWVLRERPDFSLPHQPVFSDGEDSEGGSPGA